MADQLPTAIIAAASALLGGALTGIITLINQRMTLKAADRKTQVEIADRDRTRFHEARKEAYAEFLAAVNDTTGRMLFEAVEKAKQAGNQQAYGTEIRPGYENFGPDASLRMGTSASRRPNSCELGRGA